MVDIFSFLALIRGWTSRADWSLPEIEAARICRSLAGEKRASEIGKIDLLPYRQHLAADLARAYALADQTKAHAVYFEYDLDNGWESNFFLCPTMSILPACRVLKTTIGRAIGSAKSPGHRTPISPQSTQSSASTGHQKPSEARST